jgi:hypothetical protein
MKKLWLALLLVLFVRQAAASDKPKYVRYGCEEYEERLKGLPVNNFTLIPWNGNSGGNSRFYDGAFLDDDDSRILVIFLKNDYKKRRFDHEAQFYIYDTARGLWDKLGVEFLHQDYVIIPLHADSEKIIYAKQKGADALSGEIITYGVKTGARLAAASTGPAEYRKILASGKYDISGISRELKPGDPWSFISSARITSGDKYYEGLVTVTGPKLIQKEVLRFGSDPGYIRRTACIAFRYRNGRDSFFGFYDTSADNPVYNINGDNRIFRHYESGVMVKQYVNITRLRAASPSLEKLLFMAEDEAGPRILVLSLQPGALSAGLKAGFIH